MFTIGKLASLTSVSNDTLRYYEQEGLIEPAGKSPAGYRLYDTDSARRIHFIRHAQNCGFTLAEIRELLALRAREKACCGDVRRLPRGRLAKTALGGVERGGTPGWEQAPLHREFC
jgi:DNA-binding transcriptional MerR regulator